jgi:CDP-diacylglycerol--glycerol-3-phosphate 3-phosphatidyltransferase
MGYWALRPVARVCIALGVTADAMTWSSLALALFAAASLAMGHFGLGAALSAASSLGDALDGLIARESGTASEAGEVFDATADRYAEFLFFAGLAIHWRGEGAAVGLTFAAAAGAMMVSYATAKAEALQVTVPRGAMRRQERAAYLVLGAATVPLATAIVDRLRAPHWMGELPALATLALVAVVGNISAVRRLRAVADAVRTPAAAAAHPPERPAAMARDAQPAAGNVFR